MKKNKYRFRAECKDDVSRLIMNIDTPLRAIIVDESKDFPDVIVDIESLESLESLRQIAQEGDDLHVIKETINFKEKYNGVRTYN
jgi:hypothetical protein